MLSAKLVLAIAVWLSVFNLGCRGDGSDDVIPSPPFCLNCTICEYPCHPLPQPSPQLPGYPSYEAPSPPPPLELAPPPPPKHGSQVRCPPTSATPCCQYGQYPPQNTYDGYVPNDNLSASSPLSVLVLVMVLLFSAVVLL